MGVGVTEVDVSQGDVHGGMVRDSCGTRYASGADEGGGRCWWWVLEKEMMSVE